MVAAEVKKDEVEAEKNPAPMHKELKEMLGFTNLSVHHCDGYDVKTFGFCQVETNIEAVTVPNPTKSGVDETDYTITPMDDDTKMKMGTTFAYIVHGKQSPKSAARVNLVLLVKNNPVTQKKNHQKDKISYVPLTQ